MIHVCSLARLPETVQSTGARHIITVMGRVDRVTRPAHILPDNHLLVSMDDIIAPAEGFNPPNAQHVEQLLAFAQRWDRAAERLRDVGLTVRESSNPLRLEVEIATSRITGAEAMTIAKTAYANLGGGDAVVTIYDEAGKRVAEASVSGVQGRE